MSTDGSGKPDLPVTARVEELECLSCVTPIGNVSFPYCKTNMHTEYS